MPAARQLVLAAWSLLAFPLAAAAQGSGPGGERPPARRLDSLTAGEEARQWYETRRAQNVTRQLALQDRIRWLNGLPDRVSGLRNYPPLDYIYSGAWLRADGVGSIFEPWPFVPGDLHAAPYDESVEQPLGHELQYHGRNAYTYRPVYRSPQPRADAQEREAAEAEAAQAASARAASKAYAAAKALFQRAQYHEALAALDGIDEPALTAEPALLRVQCLLAVGQFARAAGELHRVLPLIPAERWGVVVQNFRDFYDKTESFTAHLRALETYLAEHPTSAPARFLLGYQYAYLGYEAQALAQLEQAQQLMPRDRVIGQLIERVRAGAKKVPANPGAAEF